jgi:hypothetical protein
MELEMTADDDYYGFKEGGVPMMEEHDKYKDLTKEKLSKAMKATESKATGIFDAFEVLASIYYIREA